MSSITFRFKPWLAVSLLTAFFVGSSNPAAATSSKSQISDFLNDRFCEQIQLDGQNVTIFKPTGFQLPLNATTKTDATACDAYGSQTFCSLSELVDVLAQAKLCGVGSWRIPSRMELARLVDTTNISQIGGKLRHSWIWSATQHAANTNRYWRVDLNTGAINAHDPTASQQVLLVSTPDSDSDTKSTPPALSCANNYLNTAVKNHNVGTLLVAQGASVFDQKQQLEWQRCSLGQQWNPSMQACTGEALALDLAEAMAKASQFSQKNPHHWRLPTRLELGSLVEARCWSPMINHLLFPDTPPSWYWTATTDGHEQNWYVHFDFGGVYTMQHQNTGLVRLVRNIKQ